MLSSSTEFSQKTLQIKQDDKFYTRLLSKETSIANPSFRVYYGGVSGAVPFTWEIQPGTPKHKFSDNSVPPLTPPPSYYFSHDEKEKPTKKQSRSKLLMNNLFLKIKLKKSHVATSSAWSISSLSSHSHSSSMSASKSCRSSGRRFLSYGSSSSSSSSFEEDGHVYGGGSPNSMVCFGMNKGKGGDSGARAGGSTVVIMKKAVLSFVGRGSG